MTNQDFQGSWWQLYSINLCKNAANVQMVWNVGWESYRIVWIRKCIFGDLWTQVSTEVSINLQMLVKGTFLVITLSRKCQMTWTLLLIHLSQSSLGNWHHKFYLINVFLKIIKIIKIMIILTSYFLLCKYSSWKCVSQ